MDTANPMNIAARLLGVRAYPSTGENAIAGTAFAAYSFAHRPANAESDKDEILISMTRNASLSAPVPCEIDQAAKVTEISGLPPFAVVSLLHNNHLILLQDGSVTAQADSEGTLVVTAATDLVVTSVVHRKDFGNVGRVVDFAGIQLKQSMKRDAAGNLTDEPQTSKQGQLCYQTVGQAAKISLRPVEVVEGF